ncbi:MAG: 23S rRNA (guanosine(2251)-2'-O)-methyltransferase RlmB [Thermodesulfobacteriota bacterium]|nr:23S rRNA (guanosine(2251)-2'-O)-methyltransferase RlmB [Thermodesulfobacteriota bacterium]
MKSEILYGIHPIFEALKAGRRSFYKIYLSQDKASKRLQKILKAAASFKIPLERIRASKLESIAGTDLHQGIGAIVSPYPLTGLPDIIDKRRPADANHFLLLLDNVADPHNLGALIRTALCVGTDGVIITKDRSALPTPAVSRSSAGALEHISLTLATNMVSTIKLLKKKGIWIVGMDKTAESSIFSFDFSGSIAIVIGGEEKGIRPLVKKHCDFATSIPQEGQVNSLNASVAGAVVMYEAFRQRSKCLGG